jgi:ribosomal protein L7/L12
VKETTQDLVLAATEMLSGGRGVDAILSFLRANECSKVESIRLLMAVTGWPLGEAKRRVHSSPVWDDVRERDEEFHASLEDSLT